METLENTKAKVILKKGRTKSIHNLHPWLFSGAIDRIEGDFVPGDIVAVYSHDGQRQGSGFLNPHSQIAVRLLSFGQEPVTDEILKSRLESAVRFRRQMIGERSNAWRVVHGDGDRLSGLVIDQYNQAVVIQFASLGQQRLRDRWVAWIRELLNPEVIVERSDAPGVAREDMQPVRQILTGSLNGPVEIEENGIRYRVDLLEGQKTGFFLDQRDNRERMAGLAAGKKMLNCFSYTGGFSVAAAARGAQTVSVEISESAQELARENFRLNGLDPDRHQFITANVFDYLREMSDTFDVMVLDPPAFVKKKVHLNRGARGYKDINRLAMQKIRRDGLLLSCSCSHYIDWDLFQKILFAAARESGRDIQIIGKFSQPADHPINIYHPEGEYLKAVLMRVL